MYETILVPTDGSETAEAAVDEALDVAEQFDAAVYTLYVVDIEAVDLSLGTEQVERVKAGRFGEMDELEARAREATGYVADRGRDRGVEVEEHFRAGRPHDVIADFEDGNVDLDDVGIPGGIGKRLSAYDTDTAQVRGAKYANMLLGTNFASGSKPKRLYLKKVHPEFFRRMENEEGFDPQTDPLYGEFKRDPDVICFEYEDQIPEGFEVDYEKMLDKTLQGPIERVLEALDISWEEVKSGQEQTGLGSFM